VQAPPLRLSLVAVALAVATAAPGPAAPPDPTEVAREGAAKPFEDVVRLFRAGLSEDFILRKIARDGSVYRLTVDDIIACKAAGLPEPLIEAMLKTAPSPAPQATPGAAPPAPPPPTSTVPVPSAPAAAPEAPPVPAQAPTPTPPPTAPVPAVAPVPASPSPAPEATWSGLVHRSGAVVLFRSPWSDGTLSFRDGRLSWTDAGDATKSFEVPFSDVVEHFLVCPKETDFEGACWEWGVKAAGAVHRFRDEGWERTDSPKAAGIAAAVRGAHPGLAESRYRAAKRK